MTKQRRTRVGPAAILLVAACGMLATLGLSCSRQTDTPLARPASAPSDPETGFAIPEDGSLVLVLGSDATLGPLREDTGSQSAVSQAEPEAGIPGGLRHAVPFALQTALSALQAPVDGGAVLAINRMGLIFIDIRDRRIVLNRIHGADSEFAGRSVAQAWKHEGRALFLLHRNEIFETEPERSPAGRIISASADTARALSAFEPGTSIMTPENAEVYGAPFAVFPRAAHRWLIQFRLVDLDRTRTLFGLWNPEQNSLQDLDRGSYESQVRPGSRESMPDALSDAAAALSGSLILEAVLPDGSLGSWIQGSMETAVGVRAWMSETAVVALASDGRIALVDAEGTRHGTIKPPVSGASYRDVAMIDRYIVAIWEEALFPNLGRSGLVILPAALVGTQPIQP